MLAFPFRLGDKGNKKDTGLRGRQRGVIQRVPFVGITPDFYGGVVSGREGALSSQRPKASYVMPDSFF
ncbi:hypothetical protein, partial [Thiolapillus sp.]|uniref:hypothetical protein n=1 Tax=Thiolapillus sp. TaxID=2017437 RepID=UPI003AF87DF7